MKKLLSHASIGWGFLLVFLFLFTDLAQPKMSHNSDYLMTFHVAGKLVRSGQISSLYPSHDEHSFIHSAFDRAAHEELAYLPPMSTAEYMYMPLVAAIFVPFSFLPPGFSLLAWQILSLFALALSAFLVSNAASQSEKASGVDITGGWFALTLLPVAMSLWIGQCSLVLGLLPLAAGLHLWLKKREWAAGFAFSLAVMKPQFAVPALMLAGAQALSGRFKTLSATACGIAIIFAVNVVAFSPAIFSDWLRCLKLADTVYSDVKFGVAQHIATSLPRAIILLIPVSEHPVYKPIIYAVAAALGLLALFFMARLFRSKLSSELKLGLATIVAVFATPLIVPHMFLYDYVLLLLAGFVAYAFAWPKPLAWRVMSLVWLTWLVVNIYSVLVVANRKFAIPLVLMVLMLEIFRRAVMTARTALSEAPSPANSPAIAAVREEEKSDKA